MIQASTLKFLKDLKNNNSKEWFDANKKVYENAKANFIELAAQTIIDVANIDPIIAAENLEVKKCLTRINRDVRFSKNKDPYKINFFSMMQEGGKKSVMGGYYLQLQPGNSFAGGGIYMPMPPELAKLRQEIDYNLADLKKIINAKAFKTLFPQGLQAPESLSRPPKGYAVDNPAVDFLKMKGFYVVQQFTDKEVMDAGFNKQLLQTFKACMPLVEFLNNAVR